MKFSMSFHKLQFHPKIFQSNNSVFYLLKNKALRYLLDVII